MPDEDVARFNEHVSVLARSRLGLLVEDSPTHLHQLLLTMPRWKVGPEQMYKRLDGMSLAPFRVRYRSAKPITLLPQTAL